MFYLLLALGGVVWLGARHGALPLALFLDRRSFGVDLLLGAAAGGALVGLWRGALRLSSEARAIAAYLRQALGTLGREEALALALLSGFAEELFFRGAMQQAWGLLAATAAFALLHLGGGRALRLWAVFAAIAGLLFGLLAQWRGNLLAPMVAHVVVNAVNLRQLRRW